MRILLVVHMFFPDQRAGVETYTLQIARQLASAGHEVRVLAAHKVISRTTGDKSHYTHEGVEVSQVVNNLVHDSYLDSYAKIAKRLYLQDNPLPSLYAEATTTDGTGHLNS